MTMNFLNFLSKRATIYIHFHDILRLFDALPNFPFPTSETMRDYYLYRRYMQVSSRVVERLKT